jgi:hypothetical protein
VHSNILAGLWVILRVFPSIQKKHQKGGFSLKIHPIDLIGFILKVRKNLFFLGKRLRKVLTTLFMYVIVSLLRWKFLKNVSALFKN